MQAITSGFAQGVADSQFCFRHILTAMSEPGTVCQLNKHPGFMPLHAATSQVLLTLCDQDTGIYLSANLANEAELAALTDNLAFHCQAPLVVAEQADFAVVDGQEEVAMSSFKAGTHLLPETNCTLVIQTNGFHHGPLYRLTGPGIEHHKHVQLGYLSPTITEHLIAPKQAFPLGLDLIFCAGEDIIAIPRTTKVELS
ncbi:phosphonate C-P lyase system protein PhnH [Motilimonas pumila]|uniref:Phosphonate C-P lyase system protein PhnH n=1 Tax=Motilimonas pumila TaxID=2303987 RepID=A0A418YER2_9GAMM|nr:phosphonate C-P lyase system protein PhnH [Motilimonas pumila]RJG47680.1 phosphonate C-P lyase system protein PhnH [Motilimonas pumila]